MPNTAQRKTIVRLWSLMQKLPTKPPGVTSCELVENLDRDGIRVTKRTVERDLKELSRHFGLTCNDKGTPYGWYWMSETGIDGDRCLEDLEHRWYLRNALETLSSPNLVQVEFQSLKELLDSGSLDHPWKGMMKSDAPFTDQQKLILNDWLDVEIFERNMLLGLVAKDIEMVLRGGKYEDLSLLVGMPSYDGPLDFTNETLPVTLDLICPFCGKTMTQHVRTKATQTVDCSRLQGGCGSNFYVTIGDNGEVMDVFKTSGPRKNKELDALLGQGPEK